MNILLIEDDALQAAILDFRLRAEEYHVTWTSNPDKAISWSQHNYIDLVIADYMLKHSKNGCEAYAELRKFQSAAKLLIVTGTDADTILEKWAHLEPLTILAKPVEIEVLLAFVVKVDLARELMIEGHV